MKLSLYILFRYDNISREAQKNIFLHNFKTAGIYFHQEAWWQSGLSRKTRNLVPSGAQVQILLTSFFFCFFLPLLSFLPLRPFFLFFRFGLSHQKVSEALLTPGFIMDWQARGWPTVCRLNTEIYILILLLRFPSCHSITFRSWGISGDAPVQTCSEYSS